MVGPALNRPPRVRSETSPVLPVHPRLRGHAHLNSIIKFADSVRLDYQQQRDGLQGGGEGPRSGVQEDNLTLNVNKTKEMIVDFRKQQREHPPIHIDGTVVEAIKIIKDNNPPSPPPGRPPQYPG